MIFAPNEYIYGTSSQILGDYSYNINYIPFVLFYVYFFDFLNIVLPLIIVVTF